MSTQPTAVDEASKKLLFAFATMSRGNFLAGIRASQEIDGNHGVWQHHAEKAIDSLETMACHGDENAIRVLRYLGSRIAFFLQTLAFYAVHDGESKIEALFRNLTSRLEQNDGAGRHVTEDDLAILAASPEDSLDSTLQSLEEEYPGDSTVFLPKCLLKISQAEHDKSIPYLENPDNPDHLHAPEFGSLEYLTGKLASLRVRLECVKAVRETLAQAEEWPMALSAIKEQRNAQLAKFEKLKIGSNLSVSANPAEGRGKARGFLKKGVTNFAYEVYRHLEKERNEQISPSHLKWIRESYNEYLKPPPSPNNDESRKQGPISYAGALTWDWSNEWMAEAALLPPLSADESVLDSWAQAGFKLVASHTQNFSELEILPQWLYKKLTESTTDPSDKRKWTVITSALKIGFGSILSENPKPKDR